jgi:cyclohexanone monooxygenase
MDKLKDKRVGIVGTGATAIQCVSYLGKSAKELFVFQRTPSAIDDRGNKPTDPEWVKTLKPGWQAERNYNFTAILSAVPQEVDLVNDRWTDLFKALSKIMTPQKGSELSPEEMALKAELADYEKMNYIRDRVGRTVDDPETAEALMPWYRQWCKRPTFNDEYLPTFNLPNVSLVDTDGKGVERVTETSVVVKGVEYEVDCLIFATGFEVGTAYTRRSEFEVFGRDGVSLADYWADGMKTFHGLYSHGFPNCFHLGLTQTGLSPCFTYMLDGQSTHIAHIVQQVMRGNAKSVEATLEAENKWQDIVGRPSFMSDYLSHCTPGYYNGEGQSGKGKGFLEGQYGEGAVQFYDMLAKWREEGEMDGVVVE